MSCNNDSLGEADGQPTGRKIAKEWYQSVDIALFSSASITRVKKPS
jgi:hypothetical protein